MFLLYKISWSLVCFLFCPVYGVQFAQVLDDISFSFSFLRVYIEQWFWNFHLDLFLTPDFWDLDEYGATFLGFNLIRTSSM
jgi:hypothetical protein